MGGWLADVLKVYLAKELMQGVFQYVIVVDFSTTVVATRWRLLVVLAYAVYQTDHHLNSGVKLKKKKDKNEQKIIFYILLLIADEKE